MSILFEFYETPVPGGKEGEVTYHARPVTYETINTEKVMHHIHESSSLTPGDVKAALEALSNTVAHFLANGNRIHLEGIGYFQVTLKAPKNSNPKKTRAQSVWFKSVKFKADKTLDGKLKNIRTVRARYKNHSVKRTHEQIENIVKKYFKNNNVITRKTFQEICGMTRSTASVHVKRMVEEGKFKNINTKSHPIYILNND